MKYILIISLSFIFSQKVFSQNLFNQTISRWEHITNSKVLAYDNIEFKKDSTNYVKLKSRIDQINLNIKTLIENQKKDFNKDVFETTEEFKKRIENKESEITFSLRSELESNQKETKILLSKLYRISAIDKINILLDSSNYNADLGSWNIMLNMNHTLYKINILLNPIEAKILWSNRNTLSVNEIKRAYNTLPEFIEIRYGNKNEKIILLSTQAEYTSTESNIVNKFENVFTVNKIFEDVEIEAVYPSGEEGFLNYINNEIEKTFDYLWERKNFGKVEIQFKITEDGIVNDVDILPCNKTATNECLPSESWLALTLKNSIRNSPKWLPASLKGEKVHSIKRFTYNFPTDYSQTVKDAEFPGGKNSFTEYVQEKLKKHQRDLRDDGRSGTVVVIFSVDKYGVVTDIRPLPCSEAGVGNCLPPNSKLAEIAVRILQESPNWIPAEIKGHKVKAWRRLPLTYTLDE